VETASITFVTSHYIGCGCLEVLAGAFERRLTRDSAESFQPDAGEADFFPASARNRVHDVDGPIIVQPIFHGPHRKPESLLSAGCLDCHHNRACPQSTSYRDNVARIHVQPRTGQTPNIGVYSPAVAIHQSRSDMNADGKPNRLQTGKPVDENMDQICLWGFINT
jgi:hypothetical protein